MKHEAPSLYRCLSIVANPGESRGVGNTNITRAHETVDDDQDLARIHRVSLLMAWSARSVLAVDAARAALAGRAG